MEQNQYRMYVDGNTVRKAEALPKDDRQERLRREREAQRARNRKIAKRNQARELRMSRRYVAFLAVAVSITCLVCAAYVHLQADITTRMSNISALEKEIADLKTDNDTTLKRVNTSINLNEIKEKAIAELGMVYAAPDQIAYYSIEDSDYMTQYEEIPGKVVWWKIESKTEKGTGKVSAENEKKADCHIFNRYGTFSRINRQDHVY